MQCGALLSPFEAEEKTEKVGGGGGTTTVLYKEFGGDGTLGHAKQSLQRAYMLSSACSPAPPPGANTALPVIHQLVCVCARAVSCRVLRAVVTLLALGLGVVELLVHGPEEGVGEAGLEHLLRDKRRVLHELVHEYEHRRQALHHLLHLPGRLLRLLQ